RTHAKIYHVYNQVQSWVSVNFTRRAIFDNQEAGFFTKISGVQALLEPIQNPPQRFTPPRTDVMVESALSLPEIVISYDWKRKMLRASVLDEKPVRVSFLNAE